MDQVEEENIVNESPNNKNDNNNYNKENIF